MDETDWCFQLLVKFAAKEIAHGGELADRIRCSYYPTPLHIVERRGRRVLLNREEMNLRKVCFGDSFGAVVRVDQRPLHIRLPGADPNLTDQDVFERERVAALKGQFKRPAGFHWTNERLPTAGAVGGGRRTLRIYSRRNLFTGISIPPDAHLHACLQHHVIADDCGHAHLSVDGIAEIYCGDADRQSYEGGYS